MAAFDKSGSAGACTHHAGMPQPFIETLTLQARTIGCAGAALVLAAGGELLLQRGELGERRIRIHRPVTLARGAGMHLPVRAAALIVAAALPALMLVLEFVAALEALARRAPFSRGLAAHAFAFLIAAIATKLALAAATTTAVALGFGALAFVRPGGSAVLRTIAMAITIVTRPMLVGTATRTPDFDQLRLRLGSRRSFCAGSFGRGFGCRHFARGASLASAAGCSAVSAAAGSAAGSAAVATG